jgi:hypothetical protein
MPTLAQYILETRRLLHDGNAQYWTDTELTDYINDARNRVVCDTGCNRNLQTVYLSGGLEKYSYGSVTGGLVTAGGSGYTGASTVSFTGGGGSGATGTLTVTNGVVTMIAVTNGGSGYTSVPTISFGGPGSGAAATASIISPSTLDILNLSVLWSTQRIVLDYRAFTDFNARMRVWNQILSRPAVFSVYGQSAFYLGPIPDQYYTAELDSILLPANLVNTTDADILNYPWTSPVAFYAAYKAKIKEQSYNESANFLDQYKFKVLEALRSTYTRRLPNSY